MKKVFDGWNKKKKELNDQKSTFYKEREIRWCSIGINIGFEQDGSTDSYKRPVLILKGFSRNVCLILPLTTSLKKNPYHIYIGEIENKKSFAITSQIKLIDTKRLHDKIYNLNKEKFEEIRKAVRDLI